MVTNLLFLKFLEGGHTLTKAIYTLLIRHFQLDRAIHIRTCSHIKEFMYALSQSVV